ncbi:hypothetical protein K438DRAFT_1905122 [Mycena galopus ATCC 62051]|nr:hypothetical protein K438DRAFT_1905122 [Mycena galopus ATCC 62051]
MQHVDTSNSLRPRRTITRDITPQGPRRTFDLRRTATTLFTPQKKVAPAPGVWRSLRSILFASWLNVLLVFIPLSWAFNFADNTQYTLIFVFSFLAIIPLAKLLAFATDELAMRVGQTLAGLLNATLIIALTKCQLQIVQSSCTVGVGMCFFAGGIKYSEQGFGATTGASQLNSSLLTISVIAVLLPAADDLLKVSHGVALILLFIYASYLFFQLYSHAALYDDENLNPSSPMDTETALTHEEHVEEEEVPQLSVYMTVALLAVVTVLVAVTADWLVDSINGLTASGTSARSLLVLSFSLSLAMLQVQHVTAVSVSVKDKLTLSLGVAVGSSIQIALFVIPFITVLGWILNKPLTLLFDPYESIALFLAVITVNYVVADGKSNWLEGMILMCLYVILGTTFWFYPVLFIPQILMSKLVNKEYP